jgi:hypothetical protein
VFPTYWSFLLGEIALYSFIVLLVAGVYLTLFFDPSMTEVTYNGVYQPLRGIEMSKAFASALNISFEVRGGLFVRQIHHWAALMFAAARAPGPRLLHRRLPSAPGDQLAQPFTSCSSPRWSWRWSPSTWRYCGSASTPDCLGQDEPSATSSACGSCRCSR